jgi:hypothetical protein
MTRLDDLRSMRAFLDREIAVEVMAQTEAIRRHPVLLHVAVLYGVTIDQILLGDRRHRVTRARHAAAWLFHDGGMTMADTARVLGYTCKAGVHEAIARVEGDPGMRALLRELEVA